MLVFSTQLGDMYSPQLPLSPSLWFNSPPPFPSCFRDDDEWIGLFLPLWAIIILNRCSTLKGLSHEKDFNIVDEN
jgi:hypothetical protein